MVKESCSAAAKKSGNEIRKTRSLSQINHPTSRRSQLARASRLRPSISRRLCRSESCLMRSELHKKLQYMYNCTIHGLSCRTKVIGVSSFIPCSAPLRLVISSTFLESAKFEPENIVTCYPRSSSPQELSVTACYLLATSKTQSPKLQPICRIQFSGEVSYKANTVSYNHVLHALARCGEEIDCGLSVRDFRRGALGPCD